LNIHEIKHIIKTHYEDNFKKTKYAPQKNEMKNQYRKALTDLFEELLLRKIDNNGMKRYMSLLVKNEISIEGIRNDIINSREYFDRIETKIESIPKEKILEAEERVSKLFIEILNRKADREGLRRYTNSLASGGITEKEIKDEMMNSEESEFKIYKEVDVIPKLERIEYEKIINKIYQKFLLRKADKMGLIRYTLFLSNGQMTEGEIEDEVKNSPEAIDVALFITKEKAQSK
jgi:hypothetical protein